MSKFYVHSSVKILTGKYAGLVGAVIHADDEKQSIKVLFQGTFNDAPIDKEVAFKYAQVEALNNHG